MLYIIATDLSAVKEGEKVNQKEKAKKALFKKAIGFKTQEVVEEYAQNDGEIVLTKKKVTQKEVPPDCVAIKMIIESGEDYSALSTEELEKEKIRLIKLLKESENGDKKNK